MAKTNKVAGTVPDEHTDGVPAEAATEKSTPANTKRRVGSLVQELKLTRVVANAVLVEHGLTMKSMVEPSEFSAKVNAWLNGPVHK
jgi:hypothetical protein